MCVVLTQTLRIGIFAIMGFIFVTLAQARPFQATVTTNSQTMGITVTRLPGDNEVTDNLPEKIKDHALLSLEENLRIGRYLSGADWSPASVVNGNTIFQVSLDNDITGRNQEPVPVGNMTHLLWGVTYCRKYNELMQLPYERLNENEPNPYKNTDQQSTCLKEYIIQCPVSVQNSHPTGWRSSGFFCPTSSGSDNPNSLQPYLTTTNKGGDGGGGNDEPHTFDSRLEIFCPACGQFGCKAHLPNFDILQELKFPEWVLSDFMDGSEFNEPEGLKLSENNFMLSPPGSSKTQKGRRFRKKPPLIYEFILGLLYSEGNDNLLKWVDEHEGFFQVVDSTKLAEQWGRQKVRKRVMNWAKMSRAIRCGYGNQEGPILKGKGHLVYKVNFSNIKVKQYRQARNL